MPSARDAVPPTADLGQILLIFLSPAPKIALETFPGSSVSVCSVPAELCSDSEHLVVFTSYCGLGSLCPCPFVHSVLLEGRASLPSKVKARYLLKEEYEEPRSGTESSRSTVL